MLKMQNISPRAVRQSEPRHGRGRSRYRRCHVIHVSRSSGVGEGRGSGYPRITQVAGVGTQGTRARNEPSAKFSQSRHCSVGSGEEGEGMN